MAAPAPAQQTGRSPQTRVPGPRTREGPRTVPGSGRRLPGPCTDAPRRPAGPPRPSRVRGQEPPGTLVRSRPVRVARYAERVPAPRPPPGLNGREPFVREQLAAFMWRWESARAASHSLSKAGIISGTTPSQGHPPSGGGAASEALSAQPWPPQCLGREGPPERGDPQTPAPCPRVQLPPHQAGLAGSPHPLTPPGCPSWLSRPLARWGMVSRRACLGLTAPSPSHSQGRSMTWGCSGAWMGRAGRNAHLFSTCCIQAEQDRLPGPAQNSERGSETTSAQAQRRGQARRAAR